MDAKRIEKTNEQVNVNRSLTCTGGVRVFPCINSQNNINNNNINVTSFVPKSCANIVSNDKNSISDQIVDRFVIKQSNYVDSIISDQNVVDDSENLGFHGDNNISDQIVDSFVPKSCNDVLNIISDQIVDDSEKLGFDNKNEIFDSFVPNTEDSISDHIVDDSEKLGFNDQSDIIASFVPNTNISDKIVDDSETLGFGDKSDIFDSFVPDTEDNSGLNGVDSEKLGFDSDNIIVVKADDDLEKLGFDEKMMKCSQISNGENNISPVTVDDLVKLGFGGRISSFICNSQILNDENVIAQNVNDLEKIVAESVIDMKIDSDLGPKLSKPDIKVKEEQSDLCFENKPIVLAPKPLSQMSNNEYMEKKPELPIKKPDLSTEIKARVQNSVKEEKFEDNALILAPKPLSQISNTEYTEKKLELPIKRPYLATENKSKVQSSVKKEKFDDKRVVDLVIEDGDFPEDPEWLLVGRNVINGLSTTKGRKLEENEIVHFSFPLDNVSRSRSMFSSSRSAAASCAIVRFSTKRSGEVGRLPMEWAKCLIPLVNSSKVKVLGRCVAAPSNLHLMQEILLYVSFYIHHSIFTNAENTTWKLDATGNIDSTIYPLLTLFKLLKTNPFQKAEFTPEELDSRKRSLNLEVDLTVLPHMKKGKGCQQYPEQGKDEQVVSESALNKLVGAVDVYNLEEMDPPETLTCNLRPYQKQALFWMTELEKGVDVEKAAETLHPCWAAYRISDERASAIYVNIFSGEATTQFPTAMKMTRGGILADAMGLGKTVMTIALILSKPGRGICDDQRVDPDDTEYVKKRKQDLDIVPYKVKGSTLIICPMALLSQWRDELETHSKPGTVSTFVHYGGDRTNDPHVMGKHDVVLTTYGVLTAAFKSDGENSIFHRVEWFRVVLDEAHIIKSSRTLGAQAAFALTSHCRWCLTGTPLQNNLEDLYSLLCFLHVEPWCNWAWWSKLIQKPYENGDQRGMKLVKAILRPLMLRRTKETRDKEGRPILVLPPTDIQVMECEQSEAEHDFYGALFKRSKVKFDEFVAQGKVLHNYANILELLLRLRQCCNHPFLVMSRGDSQEYGDLNKLARKFLERGPETATSSAKVPTAAYVEEVIDNIREGENVECPICLESADDPVLTPCAHRMCRECLLTSWRTPLAGLCPICRQLLKKTDLITCPTDSRFRIDVEKNWKESSKVSKLLHCLEKIRLSETGAKSIVFSQWTSFLDLLEIPLKAKKIGYLRFDGQLSQKNREKVLKEFNETKEKRVLLMSLKAGGVGLNLTAASNVFLMDPWWNPAVEEQAIMRIHRIGQKCTVSVTRFIVKDTVEERMQQVQAKKQRMISGALTDDEIRSTRLEELKMLFR